MLFHFRMHLKIPQPPNTVEYVKEIYSINKVQIEQDCPRTSHMNKHFKHSKNNK